MACVRRTKSPETRPSSNGVAGKQGTGQRLEDTGTNMCHLKDGFQLQVRRPKVVGPFGHAVGLVDAGELDGVGWVQGAQEAREGGRY